MTQFHKEFIQSFRGDVSTESEMVEEQNTQPITDVERLDVHELREQCDEETDSDNEIVEAVEIGTAIVGAIDKVKQLQDASPAIAGPMVEVVNEQLKDTAKIMRVEQPELVTLDPMSGEISSPSMEGVMGWLGKAMTAFGQSLRKLINRLIMTTNRSIETTSALRRRISKVYSLINRRKNPEGGQPIKFKEGFAKNLVLGNEIVIDFASEVGRFGKVIEEILDNNAPLIDDIQKRLNEVFTALLASTSTNMNDVKINESYTETLKGLTDIESRNEMFMGNVQIRLKSEGGYLPTVILEDGKPSAEFVLKSINGFLSLSNERIRTLLVQLQEEIDHRLNATEKEVNSVKDAVARMNAAIDNISKNLSIGNEESADNFFSLKDVSKLEQRVTFELDSIFKNIRSLNSAYFDRVSSVLALIEESILQD